MVITISNIHFIMKRPGGQIVKANIESQNLSEFEGQLNEFLRQNGYIAEIQTKKSLLIVKNILDVSTGKRANSYVYSKVKGIIVDAMNKRNWEGNVTGGI